MSNPVCPNCKKKGNISRLSNYKNQLYRCYNCSNSFLFPVPKNLSSYYPPTYWQFPGQLSFIREALHNLLQEKRKNWVRKYLKSGDILDVGAGEGVFGKFLDDNFKVTNLESTFAQVNNKDVIKTDFLKWNSSRKYDGIVFLESLEHVPSQQDYLEKASTLLKKGGYIFVECPRFDCWESKFFKDKWLHLDIPRHLGHLTRNGLRILAKRSGLKVIHQSGMLTYEFSPYCFAVSLMLFLNIKPLNLRKRSLSNLTSLFLALVFLPLGLIAETIFHLLDQDPVELSIFQKS